MTYADKLKDPRWQRRRLEVFNRDSFTCQDCGNTKESLHVHHLGYTKGEPWDTPGCLLRSLCWKCHESRQKLEDTIRLKLALLFSRMNQREVCEALDSINRIEMCDFSGSLEISDAMQSAYNSDMRWFNEACEHPEFRGIYDRVSRSKTDWARIDGIKNSEGGPTEEVDF